MKPGWIAAIVGIVASGVCAAGEPTWPPLSSELLDLEARIEYGFYANEPRTIEGALDRLRELDGKDPAARYYEGLAAYRLAQVELATTPHAREAVALLDRCEQLTRDLANDAQVGTEAEILGAACTTLAAGDALADAPVSTRKIVEALLHAGSEDALNPRLALVAARLRLASTPGDHEAHTLARELLESAARALEQRAEPSNGPHWGEAEALAMLAELDLEDGKRLAARDMIERALLAAPGYRFALALKERLLSSPK